MPKKHTTIEFLHDSLQSYFAAEWLQQLVNQDGLRRLDEQLSAYDRWGESMYLMSGLFDFNEFLKLMDWCKDWQENPYALRYYPTHLLDYANQLAKSGKGREAQDPIARTVELLTDIEFIEARCRVDLLHHQRHECEATARQLSDTARREMLNTVAAAIAIETATLRRFPELTFQTLINSCRWIEADWIQPLIERWRSSWESSGRGAWLERILPPREIPQKSPIAMVLTDNFDCEALAFSCDGKYLAGAGEQSVIVWEVDSGKEVCVLEVPQFINGGLIDVAWSADNLWIAAIGYLQGYLALWDFRDKSLRFFEKIHDHGCTVAFCPQELREPVLDWDLLTCGNDSYSLWVLDENQDKVLREDLSGKRFLNVQAKILGQQGRTFKPPLVGAGWGRLDDKQVIIVATEAGDMAMLEAATMPIAHLSERFAIHHVSSSEDGRFIAVIEDANESSVLVRVAMRFGNNHALVLYDNEERDEVRGYRLKGHVAKASLLAVENRLLTCEKDTGLAILWSIVPFGMIGSWQGPSIGLTAGALGKGNRVAVSTKLGSMMLLNPEAMSIPSQRDSIGHVWSMSISPGGDSIAVARAAHYLSSRFVGDIALVHLRDQQTMSLESFKERDAALSTAYLPDGRFVTGHMDGTFRLWSPNGSLESKHLIREGVGIGSICVSRGGELVAVSCGTWYDRNEVPSTIHVLKASDMSEVFTSNAGKKGYGGKPGNSSAFGGTAEDLLICGGSPIRIWRKSDSGWEMAAEIENDLGVIDGIDWSPYLSGFVLAYGSMAGGGLSLLRPTETGWQKTVWRTGMVTLGLGLSECGQYLAFTDTEKLCRFCRVEDDGSITVLAKHFVYSAAGAPSAAISWIHRLVAFGDANGDIHVFRFHEASVASAPRQLPLEDELRKIDALLQEVEEIFSRLNAMR